MSNTIPTALLAFCIAAFVTIPSASAASKTAKKTATTNKQHAIAMRSQPKYGSNFSHFEYANPNAAKGGTLTLASAGTFDSMNPFSAKGTAPTIINPWISANVFETLMTPSLDEPFAMYGLLAESVEVGSDGLSVAFNLNPKAKWADGKPVTPEDVIFSYETLTSEKAQPFYKSYYADVKSVEKTGALTIRFNFKKTNGELHMILGQLPLLPKHFYGHGDFNKDFVKKTMGSGPYTIVESDFNKFIKAERRLDWWGKDLPVNKGRYNFSTIMTKYYKNADVMLMGLKSGDFDFMNIQSSKQWAVDVQGDKYTNGCIERQLWKHGQTEGMQGFAFNQRRSVFQDRKVRKALALALDFDWMNSTLFYKQYTPISGFFNNSDLAATGLPTAAELKLLAPWKETLPEEVFTKPLEPIGKGLDLRGRLTAAKNILEDAGWKVKNGALTNSKGEKMEFTVLLDDPSWLRIVEPYFKNLKTLGITGQTRIEDQSIYIQKLKRFDYDVIVDVIGQSESPGNEQRDYWHSTSATTEDSRNSMGIKNPAVDALIGAVIETKSRKELLTAVHALDRVLWHNSYIVPHWYMSAFRATYWNRFDLPKTMPLYYAAQSWFMNFASENPAKEAVLKEKKCK